MKKLTIRVPIWKSKSVGIASYRATDDIQIKISYKTKNGKLLYPDTYIIKKEEIIKYPTQMRSGVLLYIIPIDKLQIKTIRKRKKK